MDAASDDDNDDDDDDDDDDDNDDDDDDDEVGCVSGPDDGCTVTGMSLNPDADETGL